ncbi:MAG: hypothetical protein GSR78_02175 [Desulfurococcales archaeon]|nr:hypothetical protein [Desulfurococcales archaeon]
MAGSSRVMVVVSTGEKRKAVAGMLWAWNMKRKGLLDDVVVYFFGPSERLLAEDEEVKFRAKLLLDAGVEVKACHGFAELGGYKDKLEAFLGEDAVDHVGRLIAERIKEGYTPLVF